MSSILIIDDEPQTRELLNELLTINGHSIEEAPDALQALHMVKKKSFDIIITDIYMPNMNGIEFIRQVKSTIDAKFIVMTGGKVINNENRREYIKEWGVDDVFQKPFNISDVARCVNEL